MASNSISRDTGRAALRALFQEGSLLGPLKVMAKTVGRFFQSLYPPIHIGNRRVAEELEFREENVPAGERMFYSIYLTHRNPSTGEDAESFCSGNALRVEPASIRTSPNPEAFRFVIQDSLVELDQGMLLLTSFE